MKSHMCWYRNFQVLYIIQQVWQTRFDALCTDKKTEHTVQLVKQSTTEALTSKMLMLSKHYRFTTKWQQIIVRHSRQSNKEITHYYICDTDKIDNTRASITTSKIFSAPPAQQNSTSTHTTQNSFWLYDQTTNKQHKKQNKTKNNIWRTKQIKEPPSTIWDQFRINGLR